MSKPEFRESMTMHMNGGSHFSELHYAITADGKPTKITRHKRTNGSPKYLITDDAFVCGGDRFDMLETKGVGLENWLLAHAPQELKIAEEPQPEDAQ